VVRPDPRRPEIVMTQAMHNEPETTRLMGDPWRVSGARTPPRRGPGSSEGGVSGRPKVHTLIIRAPGSLKLLRTRGSDGGLSSG
jgi:hypothetical protein